jgi:hypothetical protein
MRAERKSKGMTVPDILLAVVAVLLVFIGWDLRGIRGDIRKIANKPPELSDSDITEGVEDALYNHFIEQRYRDRKSYKDLRSPHS